MIPRLAPTLCNPSVMKKKRPRRLLKRDRSFLYLLTVMASLYCYCDEQLTGVDAFQTPPRRLAFQAAARPTEIMPTFIHFHEPRIRLRDSEGDPGATIVASTDLLHNQAAAQLANKNGASGGTNQTFVNSNSVSDRNGHQVNGAPPMDGSTNETMDVPLPTENGGFTHTSASRAKISAANKGKVPWNKGRSRSPQERARIAAGVRAKNRQRFLEKLETLGMTEEEYNKEKKAERRAKDQERRARKTKKGGYRPTKETREKISKILKEKWSKGEIKKRAIDPQKVRRGFTHSEETRAKISAALKKRWAQDAQYRKVMMEKSSTSNASEQVKKRISETLKKKWQDPEFRNEMLAKMEKRRKVEEASGTRGQSHRDRISAAMKAKWQDEEYRNKTIAAIQKQRAEMAALRPKKTKAPRTSAAVSKPVDVRVAKPIQPKQTKPTRKRVPKKSAGSTAVKQLDSSTPPRVTKKKQPSTKTSKVLNISMNINDNDDEQQQEEERQAALKAEPDGSINRLREERRDLYDLLYGDDGASSQARLNFGDENLDTFDPYGLDDF